MTQSFEDRARAEAERMYPSDYEVDDPFGETGAARSDPYGYDEYANRAFMKGALWAREQGCCTSCDGSGRTDTPDTNGHCWDCRGTGHPHDQEPTDAQAAGRS